ncbi:MAG: RsmB/NOP family class I SAM-dependent RNA methyltransferase, partial [Rhodospirillales bacterium]|nr:RsmB/NOP family class I SAM-dependent RNA methyltransferase [Rhodospirillales bacterium]
QAEETPISPYGVRVLNRLRLGGISVFKDGKVDVQDEGSQLLSFLVDARPGMTVVDYCAGAGGKTLALAAQMKDQGSLIACDVSTKRLGRMSGRLKKAGVQNVQLVELSTRKQQPEALRPNKADRVLLDVPCSGTGTWRRSPDSKWRIEPSDLDRHIERQAQIFMKASNLVKPGGRLIYMTCSLLREENENQVFNFLGQMPDFRTIPVSTIWNEVIEAPCPTDEPFLRLTPKDNGTDGFFLAALERKE